MKHFLKIMAALALAVGLSGCTFHEDSGVWRGSVLRTDGSGPSKYCDLEVDIAHSDQKVVVHSLTTNCDSYSLRWRPGTYEVFGETIWRQGRPVGWARANGSASLEISDYAGMADERYPLGAHKVVLSWHRTGASLEFTEEAHFHDRVQRTSGWLRRK